MTVGVNEPFPNSSIISSIFDYFHCLNNLMDFDNQIGQDGLSEDWANFYFSFFSKTLDSKNHLERIMAFWNQSSLNMVLALKFHGWFWVCNGCASFDFSKSMITIMAISMGIFLHQSNLHVFISPFLCHYWKMPKFKNKSKIRVEAILMNRG